MTPSPPVGRIVVGGRSGSPRQETVLPGLALCALAVATSSAVHRGVPSVSVLMIAIVLGVVLTNVVRLPAMVQPGLAFSAKRLLRLGIVLLGLQLLLGDVLGLGAGMLGVVVVIVAGGIGSTLLVGRLLGIGATQRLLIACGFSICGAAAVAAVDGVVDADEEEVVTAVALVVLFGTLMIPLVPLAAAGLDLSEHVGGLWAGGAIHEVAQVVAAGGAMGGTALTVAVVVKLARVLMLAPVLAVVSWQHRRQPAGGPEGRRPPLVPLFVVGFLAMVVVRSSGIVPEAVLDVAGVVQVALLSAAMFALGCGVRLSSLRRVGPRPLLLALTSTIVVAGVSLGGVLLVS
ncbi:putative sulfate exporter family transporter [Blastococcus sp. BMG 814]|uniref:Sulfate exporter family transporter n=1 Tax=Blastococcus carthaginiensis TaxID=3050034 RepID=A0ABT9I9P9_9ACTN|nr:putative sulfate exporter family transporter [Blastococcus carthaginiensis]MDP5181899.1 putative sulfate exporter family transporter [Blastococcus carthaginiensis]